MRCVAGLCASWRTLLGDAECVCVHVSVCMSKLLVGSLPNQRESSSLCKRVSGSACCWMTSKTCTLSTRWLLTPVARCDVVLWSFRYDTQTMSNKEAASAVQAMAAILRECEVWEGYLGGEVEASTSSGGEAPATVDDGTSPSTHVSAGSGAGAGAGAGAGSDATTGSGGAHTSFLAGTTSITAADCAMFPVLAWLQRHGMVLRHYFPALGRYFTLMANQSAVRRSTPVGWDTWSLDEKPGFNLWNKGAQVAVGVHDDSVVVEGLNASDATLVATRFAAAALVSRDEPDLPRTHRRGASKTKSKPKAAACVEYDPTFYNMNEHGPEKCGWWWLCRTGLHGG